MLREEEQFAEDRSKDMRPQEDHSKDLVLEEVVGVVVVAAVAAADRLQQRVGKRGDGSSSQVLSKDFW